VNIVDVLSQDASKKIFVVTGILVFDFELFIGARWQKRADNSLKLPAR